MSEVYWQIIVGFLLIFGAVLGFLKPGLFMYGRRSGFWLPLLGEEKTKKLIRYVSVPLALIIAFILIAGAMAEIYLQSTVK
jgi:hypothetical protein